MTQANILQSQFLKDMHSNDTVVSFMGDKPWYARGLNSYLSDSLVFIKYAATSALFVGFLHATNLTGSTMRTETDVKTNNSFVGSASSQESLSKSSILENFLSGYQWIADGGIKQSVGTELLNKPTNHLIPELKAKYPSVNFDEIETARQSSQNFVGVNNFIALASEMEGFKGNLHKDPATGLNIGFGYNITKRLEENRPAVIKDLLAIDLPIGVVTRIIGVAESPQNKLNGEIKKLNTYLKDNGYPVVDGNPQLINVVQGVGLLERTQQEYKTQARNSFGDVFEKMGVNQQEVLTYAAYKAGEEALSKYRNTIQVANAVYSVNSEPSTKELQKIAKGLTFYYKKDGGEMVLDERASLIAHTFYNQDYLSVQVGSPAGTKNSVRALLSQKIDLPAFQREAAKVEKAEKAEAAIKLSSKEAKVIEQPAINNGAKKIETTSQPEAPAVSTSVPKTEDSFEKRMEDLQNKITPNAEGEKISFQESILSKLQKKREVSNHPSLG